MSRILLVNPAYNWPVKRQMYPSGALLLLGTILSRRGDSVRIVDCIADAPVDVRAELLSFKPDFVGVTVSTLQVRHAREVLRIAKTILPGCVTMAGGAHVSTLSEQWLGDSPDCDVAVIGEGETTVVAIVEGKDCKEIKGIAFRDGASIVRNEPAALVDLDAIPPVDWSLVSYSGRYVGATPAMGWPSMYLMASRGCPFHCSFCNESVFGHTLRYRSPEVVLAEMEAIISKLGAREIFLQDDTFNMRRGWCEAIMRGIIERGLNKICAFKTPFRVNEKLVDVPLLKLAREANFRMIFYGVESGNQAMLDSMRKGTTIEEIVRAFRLTHEAGIKTYASFIVGMPGETEETVAASMGLYKKISPFWGGCAIIVPLPGTPLTAQVKGEMDNIPYDEYTFDRVYFRTKELDKATIRRRAEQFNSLIRANNRKNLLLNPDIAFRMLWAKL